MTLPNQLFTRSRAAKRVAPKIALALLAVALLQFGAHGCRTKATNTSDQLLEASRAAGVQVHADEVFTLSRGSETVTAAPIAGWEQVPATDLRKGVNFAYAYFSTQEPKVPAGYYTLRAFADVNSVGTSAARVQLLDRDGKIAAEVPAEVEVHSLTVPQGVGSLRSFVTATDDRATLAAQVVPGIRPRLWFRCPNGQCIRMLVLSERMTALASR